MLDVDPELGARLAPDDLARARARVVAPMFELQAGPWNLPGNVTEPGILGVMVLDGLVGVYVGTEERCFLELLGRDDVLQPWVTLGADASTPTEIRWEVFQPTRVMVLGGETAAAICEFPTLVAALMTRLVLRSRRLAFQLAVHSVVRVEDRLHLMLWHFADRWGRVTRDGVVIDLPLTHQQLADVAGTLRPSLTSGVRALEERGAVSREPGRRWVLHGQAPALYRRLSKQAALAT